jgi:hypothetical protein
LIHTIKRNFRFWHLLIAAISLVALLNCAKTGAPGGGPLDKTPPDILAIKPDPGSVSVDTGEKLEIIFSKNMDKESVEKAIFISPLFFDYPSYEWSGKKLKIKLPENLKPNTTYSITIGASAKDTRGNQLGKSRSYSFSTGEKINSGKIEGRILIGTLRGIDAWAYRLDSLPPDSFMFRIPDYITQTDSLGGFLFEFLGKGKYLIIGVDDKNKNQFWTPPSEKIALPTRIIELADDSASIAGLILVASDQDTTSPIFSKVVSPNSGNINIEFSHQILESSFIKADAFKVIPMEESSAQVFIFRIYPLMNNSKTIAIDCKGMQPGRKYKLEAHNIESVFSRTADSLSQIFTAGAQDTLAPTISAVFPKPSNTPLIAGFDIKLTFSESIETKYTDSMIVLKDSSGNIIPISYQWHFPNEIIIKSQMKDAEVYIVTLNEKLAVDTKGNVMGDSTITYEYKTASSDTLGEISGKMVGVPADNMIILAFPVKGDTITTKMNVNQSFRFDQLFPTTYYINAYHDINQNGRLDPGQIIPFKYSEPVAVYGDTIVVRPRWETDIGQMDFNQ